LENFFFTKETEATIQIHAHAQYLGAHLLYLLGQLLPGIAMTGLVVTLPIEI
jgi:hypothetical protein